MFRFVEYLWIDGAKPTQKIRSKTRILKKESEKFDLVDIPEWSFDGSSTYQAVGNSSDLILRPVNFVQDPTREAESYLVMCEVMNPDGSAHESNYRARLRQSMENGGKDHDPWVGFEQEYTLFKGNRPLGWPESGYPAPQGPFYCGVGADEVFGRRLVEEHALACLKANIMLFGINAEVMPGQWEFQIGYRNVSEESADPLMVSDHLWFARWLLYRLGEKYGISATLDPKPIKGDWNGAGKHTNFSTKSMRDPATGRQTIENAVAALEQRHNEHIVAYGHALSERLTGLHETCNISEFRSGVSDRGASIRIPISVEQKGCGYIEDRRPGANADPYRVCLMLVQTVCNIK